MLRVSLRFWGVHAGEEIQRRSPRGVISYFYYFRLDELYGRYVHTLRLNCCYSCVAAAEVPVHPRSLLLLLLRSRRDAYTSQVSAVVAAAAQL